MNVEMSRRQFLGAAVGAGAALLVPNAVRSHEVPEDFQEPLELLERTRNIQRIGKFALEMAWAEKSLEGHYPLIRTMSDVYAFRDEYVPYLARIGYRKSQELVFPEIELMDYGDEYGAEMDFSLLGESYCVNSPGNAVNNIPPIDGDDHITINERYFTKYSPMQTPEYNPKLVATLAHEIAHSNQLSCEPMMAFFGDYKGVEGATQIVSTNALAAMAMDGSPLALPAFLDQMKSMSRGWVLRGLYETQPDGTDRLDEYEGFLDQFPDHSRAVAAWKLRQMTGTDRAAIFAAIDYGAKPFDVMADAINNPPYYQTAILPVPTKTLKIPQTRDVLGNLSHYVNEFGKGGE